MTNEEFFKLMSGAHVAQIAGEFVGRASNPSDPMWDGPMSKANEGPLAYGHRTRAEATPGLYATEVAEGKTKPRAKRRDEVKSRQARNESVELRGELDPRNPRSLAAMLTRGTGAHYINAEIGLPNDSMERRKMNPIEIPSTEERKQSNIKKNRSSMATKGLRENQIRDFSRKATMRSKNRNEE